MREVSVVISWMDPTLIVDLFFGLPQLGWAMPAPTMQLREAPPEYPIDALKSRLWQPQLQINYLGVALLEMTSWTMQLWKRSEEELSSEMILGPFFDLRRRPVSYVSVYFAGLVLGNSTEAPRIQLCG